MASWDDEDFDQVALAIPRSNKWEGEDDDEVLESWDAEETDEVKKNGETETTAPKKKSLKERIAEKEEKKRQEVEERRKREAEERNLMNEKEREKLAEEAEMMLLADTFGKGDGEPGVPVDSSIDLFQPKTKEDFDKLSKLITDKLLKYEKSIHYTSFLESLFRDVSVDVDVDQLRKLSLMFTAIANEKLKMLKPAKGKKKKGKTIQVVRANDVGNEEDADYIDDDDFDDFM